MNKTEFIKIIKDHQKNNKNKWFNAGYLVDGKTIQLKFYNKYIQAFYINGLYIPGGEFKTQKEFIQFIETNLN